MPIYEFRCQACAHVEEVLQKVNDPTPEVCASCGKTGTLTKGVSQTSFQLKGGGWYSDLYGSTPKNASAKATAETPTKAAEKPEAKAPEAKSSSDS